MPVRLQAEKPRALLALLLLNRNRVVPTERLVEELWGEEPPARATKALQVYVSQLRKALGPERLVTRPPGYELRVDEGELDVARFESLVAAAREQLSAGNARAAVKGLREALELWPGAARAAEAPAAGRPGAGSRAASAAAPVAAHGRRPRRRPPRHRRRRRVPAARRRQLGAPDVRRQARELPRPVARRPRPGEAGDQR